MPRSCKLLTTKGTIGKLNRSDIHCRTGTVNKLKIDPPPVVTKQTIQKHQRYIIRKVEHINTNLHVCYYKKRSLSDISIYPYAIQYVGHNTKPKNNILHNDIIVQHIEPNIVPNVLKDLKK